MPRHSVVLATDETDLLWLPLLRSAWAKRGGAAIVDICGRNARRVIFGALNLRTGHRLLEERDHNRQEDFQAYLDLVRWHYRSWHVALLLDENRSHTAEQMQVLAEELDMELLWLLKRTPTLGPMDHLWGHAKETISVNRQYDSIAEHVKRFLEYLENLAPREALRKAGVLSDNFWLKDALSLYL